MKTKQYGSIGTLLVVHVVSTSFAKLVASFQIPEGCFFNATAGGGVLLCTMSGYSRDVLVSLSCIIGRFSITFFFFF